MNILTEIVGYVNGRTDKPYPSLEDCQFAIEKLVEGTNWRTFFVTHSELTMPTQDSFLQEIAEVRNRFSPLGKIALFVSLDAFRYGLRDLVDADASEELLAIVNEYFVYVSQYMQLNLTESELRSLLPELLASTEDRQKLQRTHETGEVCIHCGSTNVHTKGKLQWICYDCGKCFSRTIKRNNQDY